MSRREEWFSLETTAQRLLLKLKTTLWCTVHYLLTSSSVTKNNRTDTNECDPT